MGHRQLLDARTRKTRSALHGAFVVLMQRERYENLAVADITARAGVSRSTFYAHYAGMDGLLMESIAGPFAILADTVGPEYAEEKLIGLLEHFWENRALARGLLVGPVKRKTGEVLVGLIAQRLRTSGLRRRGALILPVRLAAIQLAEVLLAPITAWLLGDTRCSTETLATALRRVSIAALNALIS